MNNIIKAENLIIGLQLIVENSEDVVNSGLCSGKNKMILNNLSKRCENLIEEFWKNMDDNQEEYYNNKIKKLEEWMKDD